jgi:glucose/arabinose dehydrogenase
VARLGSTLARALFAAATVSLLLLAPLLSRGHAAVPSAGLIAHWSFDETRGTAAADSSGHGHGGSLTYGPAWRPAEDCKVGGCLSLDGVDDYVKVLDTASLRVTGDVTVSAWIKPTSLATKQSVVSKRYEYELGPLDNAAPNPLHWSHKNSSGTVISGKLTSGVDAGAWQHVVLVRDAAAKRVTGYENGALADVSTYAAAPATSSYQLNIGRNPAGNQHFKGLVDEVRVYRRALSDAEIQELYTAGDAPPPPPPPPDTQAPTTPASVSASAVSETQVDVSWTPANDDRGVNGYRVFRDGAQVAAVTGTAYRDGGRSPATTYAYRIAAVDAAGNVSPQSAAASATTPAAAPAPPQRQDVTLASGLAGPTSMGIAPDGRVFVAEQGGKLRVVRSGGLQSQPFLSVPVTSSNERGLLGVTFDPDFGSNGYVYVYYTRASPVVNRLSRFKASSANPDVAEAGSETVILDDIPSQTGWHNGGAIHFGTDGKLYVAVGEGHASSNAQRLDTLAGKLLRINRDGSIPADNPFYGSATGVNRAIWAYGLRNPFTFDVQPTTGRIFINDVGENAHEEINEAWSGPNNGTNAGFNFGWPTTEGPTSDPRFKSPFHSYPQTGGDCALTGGAFYNPGNVNFPTEYVGDYFFADYCSGWIKSLDLATKQVSTFIAADGTRDPVDLKVSDDGSLYYLARANGGTASVHRLSYVGASQPPSIVTQPQPVTAPAGGSATFTVSASGSAPLSYRWQRNGQDIAGGTGSSYTLSNAQAADDGTQFRVVVTNGSGSATSQAATLRVTANQPPTAAITAPASDALYSGGERIDYAGTGTDSEDGTLPADSFSWRVEFHHEEHTHPFMPDTAGSRSGTFTIPTTGETSPLVWYRIYLTIRDAGGLSSTTYRDVLPRKARITLDSSVPGLQLELDGQPHAAPHSVTGVVGVNRLLGAPATQSAGGRTYAHVSWSDGGAASHTIATPAADTTYTATYREQTAQPPGPAPTAGLVGHWAFDEGSGTSAADGSGRGHAGLLTYGPAWRPAAQCKVGGCLSLDGVNDYVRVLDAAPLRLTGSVTVAAWIRPASVGAKQSLVSKRYEYELGPLQDAAPHPLNWSHKAAGGALMAGNVAGTVAAGAWQHVVLVRDAAAKRVSGYVDGAAAVTGSYEQVPDTSTYNLNIGRNPGGNQWFGGLVDEVRVYDRALTAAEVAAVFNAR